MEQIINGTDIIKASDAYRIRVPDHVFYILEGYTGYAIPKVNLEEKYHSVTQVLILEFDITQEILNDFLKNKGGMLAVIYTNKIRNIKLSESENHWVS